MKTGYALAAAAAAFAYSHATIADQPSASTSAQLQEVTITAEKVKEPLIRAPLAVTAISQAQLRAAGVVTVADLPTVAPGVQVNSYPLLNTIQMAIRGISTRGQGSDPLNSAVAVYVDGVYSPYTDGLQGAMFDLSQVEVLRGPQGILYGVNAPAGAIDIITATPTQRFGAAYDISYGNYGDLESHGMLNVPVTDTLAVRGAYLYSRGDGYYNTEGTTARNLGASDNRGGRLSALWNPTTNFNWRLEVDNYVTHGTQLEGFETAPNGKPTGNVSLFGGPVPSTPEPADNIDNSAVRSHMNWQINKSLSASYIAGYQISDYNFATQFEASPNPFISPFGYQNSHSTYQEVDITLDTHRWRNVSGFTYSHGSYDALVDDPVYPFNANIAVSQSESTKSWGVFDQATFRATDHLRLIGGLRYSSDWKSYAETDYLCAIDILLTKGGNSAQCGLDGYAFNDSTTWTHVDWKAAVVYDLSGGGAAYLSATTGYMEGGFNNADPNLPVYKPEDVINYEFGYKNHLFHDHASLKVALFYDNYKNIQVTQQTLFPFTANAAAARIYGAEIEGSWKLTSHDRLDAFFTPLRATYTNYTNGYNGQTGTYVPSLNGNHLPDAPDYSGRVQYEHVFEVSNGGLLTPSAAVYWQSASYLREFDLPIDRVPSYTKTNLSLTYEDPTGHWRVAAFVHNLENNMVRDGYQTILGRYDSYYGEPRTYGARISYDY